MPRPGMPARTTTLPAFTPVLPRRPPPAASAHGVGNATPNGASRPHHAAPDRAASPASRWRPSVAGARGLGRAAFGATGLLPCLLTSASTALCVQPWVPQAVAWSQRTTFLRHAAPLLGAHAGVPVLAAGLVLAATTLAVLQLARQRFGAPANGGAALLAAHAPQLALGLALAPCLFTFSGVVGPAAGLVVAATVAISTVLCVHRALGRAPSPMGAAALLGACLLAGPPGWSVACGMAPRVAVAQSVVLYALWLTASAAVAAAVHKLLHDAPTPFFDHGLLDTEALRPYRFERPAPPGATPAGAAGACSAPGLPPTIFDVDAELWQLVERLRPELPADPTAPFLGFRGQPVCHLHGPAGGGKTRSTLGLARELGAHYRATDANELEADRLGDLPVAAINACLLLLSADAYGRKVGRPVAFFIDEVDALLPSPDGKQDQARINKALGYSLFVHTLRLLQRNGSYVLLITATNRYAAYREMLQLFGQNGSVYLGAPGPQSKRKVLAAGLHDTSLALRRTYGVHWAPLLDEQRGRVDALLARCEAEGALSLRAMANLAQVALEAGLGEASRQGHARREVEAARGALVTHAFAAMHAELDARREELGEEPPASPASDAPDREAQGASSSSSDASTPGADADNAGAAAAQPVQSGARARTGTDQADGAGGPAQPLRRARPDRSQAQAEVNLDRLLQRNGLRDTSMVQVFQTIAENLGREYPKPENAVRFAELELRLANVFYLSLLHILRAASVQPQPPLHHQVYVPEPADASWLPDLSALAAAGLRAAQGRLRANAVLRRASGRSRRHAMDASAG